MKIAIVGGRNFDNYQYLKTSIDNKLDELNIINDVDTVVSGGARGADSLGEKYADEYSLEKMIFPADWKKYGRHAGFIRNVDIIKKHDIELCNEYNKPCYIFKY